MTSAAYGWVFLACAISCVAFVAGSVSEWAWPRSNRKAVLVMFGAVLGCIFMSFVCFFV